MDSKSESTCTKHGTALFPCKEENCSLTLCKVCVFEDASQAKHLSEHFDSFKSTISSDVAEYEKKLKEFEGYEILNKCFLAAISQAKSFLETTYEKVYSSKLTLDATISNALVETYEGITSNFEDTVKEVNAAIEKLDMKNPQAKDNFKAIKRSLDEQTDFLDSEEKIKQKFDLILAKAEKRINGMTVSKLSTTNLRIGIGRFGVSLDFVGYGINSITTNPGKNVGGSYWCVRSEEVLEGCFIARVKIIAINPNNVTNYWNYGIGICKAESTNDSSYYNDSVVFLSNGWLANKFSGSGSYRQIFQRNWVNNDEIIIKRDESNTVFFGINDEGSLVKAFDSIGGNYRIIIGFGQSMLNDTFELIEIDKF